MIKKTFAVLVGIMMVLVQVQFCLAECASDVPWSDNSAASSGGCSASAAGGGKGCSQWYTAQTETRGDNSSKCRNVCVRGGSCLDKDNFDETGFNPVEGKMKTGSNVPDYYLGPLACAGAEGEDVDACSFKLAAESVSVSGLKEFNVEEGGVISYFDGKFDAPFKFGTLDVQGDIKYDKADLSYLKGQGLACVGNDCTVTIKPEYWWNEQYWGPTTIKMSSSTYSFAVKGSATVNGVAVGNGNFVFDDKGAMFLLPSPNLGEVTTFAGVTLTGSTIPYGIFYDSKTKTLILEGAGANDKGYENMIKLSSVANAPDGLYIRGHNIQLPETRTYLDGGVLVVQKGVLYINPKDPGNIRKVWHGTLQSAVDTIARYIEEIATAAAAVVVIIYAPSLINYVFGTGGAEAGTAAAVDAAAGGAAAVQEEAVKGIAEALLDTAA